VILGIFQQSKVHVKFLEKKDICLLSLDLVIVIRIPTIGHWNCAWRTFQTNIAQDCTTRSI